MQAAGIRPNATHGGYIEWNGVPGYSLVAIATGELDPRTAMGHESWHHVWKWLLTDAEHSILEADIAKGATNALAAIAPGPVIESPHESTKNNGGNHAGVPPQARTPRRANASNVPLSCAIPNNNVTPASVRNKAEGKKPNNTSALKPAAYTPTGKARAIAKIPTLMREVRLNRMTASSAMSDRVAGFMRSG
jgi:hypothetical protein